MYLSSFFRGVRSHWYLVLAGLVATGVLCVAAVTFVPAKYEAQASVLLLPARSPTGDNALLGIGGLEPTADTVARAMTDSAVQDGLLRAGAGGQYLVILDPLSKSPVLQVTATDVTPSGAMTTLRLVVDEVGNVLADLQARVSVPAKARLDTMVLARDKEAKLVLKSRIRLIGGTLFVGLALTFGQVVFLESREPQRAAALRRGRARGSKGRHGGREEQAAQPDALGTRAFPIARQQGR